MSSLVIYGIETCDQVRTARAWFRARGITVRLHDFRSEGLTPELLDSWLGRLPWDSLLNRRGLAWRRLDSAQRAQVTDASSAAELMLAMPLLVKRPVLEHPGGIIVGFSESVYENLFSSR